MSDRPRFDADLADAFREINSKLDILLARSERPQAEQPGAALLRAINSEAGERIFSCAELCAHASLSPKLTSEIVAACGTLNARKLGKILRRLEGENIDGLRIARIGADRYGIVWRCEFAE